LKTGSVDLISTRVLLEVGQVELAGFLGLIQERLAASGLAMPDPALPKHLYLDHLGHVLASVGLRLWRPASDPDDTSSPPVKPPVHVANIPAIGRGAYSLRRGMGVWHLRFAGSDADLKHEKAILYVSYLFTNPPIVPLHALDLCARIQSTSQRQYGLEQIADPATGKAAPLAAQARIQERSLSLDDAEVLLALRSKEKELEAILDDDDESEPVKAEAARELEALAQYQRQHSRRTEDNAQRAVRAVRRALTRFHQRLFAARDAHGNPHPVLHPFAEHIEKYLLIPSARYSGKGGRARGGLAGCFTYEPPPGVKWTSD